MNKTQGGRLEIPWSLHAMEIWVKHEPNGSQGSNADFYISLENIPKKARALIGQKSCLYNSMETQN